MKKGGRNFSKIKIAHIITLLELGGAQKNTLYTVENLNRKHFNPILICGKGGYLDNEAKKIKDLKIYFISSLVREVRPWLDFIAFFHLLFIFLKEKPKIIHTHSSKAGILARWAGFFSGVPVIIHTFHGFGFNIYQRRFVMNFFIFLEQLTAKITTKLISVSKNNITTAIKNRIGRIGQYELIHSGIKIKEFMNKSPDRSYFNLKPDEKIVAMISPFKIQKDPLSFIDLAKSICEKRGDVKFFLIGDGVLRPKIEKKIIKHNLKDRLLLLGWQNNVKNILSITDIFVLTSLWEGLPRALVEAMTMAIPCVVTSVDGINDIIVDGVNGFLVKPKEIGLMAEKVIKLLNDENLRKEIGKNARETILTNSFDIDEMVAKQEKLYLNLYEQHR